MKHLNIALAQINAKDSIEDNIDKSLQMINEATKKGANWVMFPELSLFRAQKKKQPYPKLTLQDPLLQPLFKIAKQTNTTLLIGFPEQSPDPKKVYNTSAFILPDGSTVIYQKKHLFSVNLPTIKIDESQSFIKGKKPVVADIAGISVGMSICYDIRFPELYRLYSQKGAKILAIPSSFTTATGQHHWHTLCKARAIENLAFVCAPNQVGFGAEVPTYGHSLIVSPWGDILAEGSDKEDVIMATLDFDKQNEVRMSLPSLAHRELF